MFYKIGFYILLIIVILAGGVFIKSNPMKNQGAMSWADIYSNDPSATIGFLNQNFGITVASTNPTPTGQEYSVIKAKGQLWPFAGVMATPVMPDGTEVPEHTVMYLTVTDYAATHEKMLATGAKSLLDNVNAEGMLFGIYQIPGGVTIGIAQYGVK